MTNKKIIIIVSFISFLLLSIATILRIITPQEPSVPAIESTELKKNVDNSTSTFDNISYTGLSPDFPKRVPILTLQKTTNEQILLSSIINKFNFTQSGSSSNFWQNENEQTMNYDRFSKTYFVRVAPLSQTNQRLQKQELISIAQNYISDIFQTSLSPITSEVSFYQNGLEQPQKSDQLNADYIKVPLAISVSNIPIMYENSAEYPFFVTLDMSGNISTFSFTPTIMTFNETGEKSLLSTKEAVDNINKNQATIISAGITKATFISLEQISEGNLSEVSLEYRVDSETGYIIPYFKFSGDVNNSNGTKMFVEITTPAVKTN